MAHSSSHKPGVFSKLWRSVKPAVARFPALFVLGIVTAVAMEQSKSSHPLTEADWFDEYMARLVCAGTWGMAFSVLAQLLAERRHGRRAQLAAQAVIFVLSLAVVQLLFLPFNEDQRSVLCVGVMLALCAIIIFILMRTQGNYVALSNCIVSAAIAGFFSLCALAGNLLLLILFECIVSLIGISYDSLNNIFGLILCLSPYVFFPMIFIARVTRERKREQISPSFAYEVIVLCIFLTIGISFFALLYLYLFKCLFTLTMPTVREVYLYVALATGGYLFFYFASLPYESPFLVFFRRYGAIFLAPLLAMQIAAFTIKVNTEGYTPARVAALFYIIFSVASCALTFIKRGKYMDVTFLIFAALCILRSAIIAMGN